MKKISKVLKMNNAVDAATSSYCWGKKAKRYAGVAGKGGNTTNCEFKTSAEKESN